MRRALKAGRLKLSDDGTLAESLVGSGWRRNNRRADKGADTAPNVRTRPASAPVPAAESTATEMEPQPHGGALKRSRKPEPDDVARSILVDGDPMNMADAELLKESSLARLRQLEYDQKSGAVVAIADVAKVVGEAYAQVRTRLLAIPAEQAPRLQRLKTVVELEDALREIITKALGALTDGSDGGA